MFVEGVTISYQSQQTLTGTVVASYWSACDAPSKGLEITARFVLAAASTSMRLGTVVVDIF